MTARFFKYVSLAPVAITLTLVGCDEGMVVQPDEPDVTVASVTVTPSTVTLALLGDTATVTAQAKNAAGSVLSGKTFTWSTSDGTIATVSTSGLVTAVAVGNATITATVDAVSGTAAAAVGANLPTTSSGWVSFVNWDDRTVVDVGMVETSASDYSFSLGQTEFEAGKPYVLRITNPASNSSKHYFSPKEALGSFYKAIATRKVQTAEAEYKAPYFDAVELKIGGTLEVYFVPVVAGTYDIICTIPGHEALGMATTVTITGGGGFQLDLEVAADFNTALASDERRSGSHAVWSTAHDTEVDMFEGQSSFAFTPPNLALTKDLGYKLKLDNPTSHASKHYYTAAEFYKTVVLRKADDSQAEIKAPYLKAVELLIGGETTLYIVPTATGTYEVLCTIPGHADLGMTGNVVVSQGNPTTSSGWVGLVNWDNKTVVDVGMVETSATNYSFSLSQTEFEAGKPYVLRIDNPATNDAKHYFSPKTDLGSFYKAVATRKVQTAQAEYKAPYFDAVELKIGGTLEVYFVPVLPGTYNIICTIPGHEALGMAVTVTIYGDPANALDLEVASDFNTALTSDARRSGSHAVWASAVDTTVSMVEGTSTFSFQPPDVPLTKDIGYKFALTNSSGHASKHYYTAAEFYKTVVLRKADDAEAEIKAPYLKAVELLIGGSTTLYIVPTVTGTFSVLCTIAGHADLGMTGTIVVGS